LALCGWGAWRRGRLSGQLALVAGASLLAATGYAHPAPMVWMVLPAPLVLGLGLAVAQPPEARIANGLLMLVAAPSALDVLGWNQGSLPLASILLLHWTFTALLAAPSSRARKVVVGGLLLLPGSAFVLGLYFLALGPSLGRLAFTAAAGLLGAA